MKFNNPHARNDALHLALDQATAAKIRARPELVEIGRQNLHRWRVQSEGELSPAHQEWELILRFLPMNLPVGAPVSDSARIDNSGYAGSETGAPFAVQGFKARKWFRGILTPDEIADFIVSETPKAKRLRQSSPLVGILREGERLAILHYHEKAAA